MRSLASLIALLVLAAPAASQGEAPGHVHVVGRDSVERYRIVVAPFSGDAATDEAVRTVVRDDLVFSQLFDVLAPGADAPYRLEGLAEVLGAEHVVTFTLRQTDGDRVLTARRLRGSKDTLRRIGHRISDEVVKALFGHEGSFDTRIAYVHGTGKRRDVWSMDYDGARPTRVTEDNAIVLSPEVSLDGSLMLFTSYVEGPPGVYAIRRQTGDVRRLFRKEGLNQSPSFAPDASRIALSASFEGNSEIYASDFAGTNLRRLTDHPSIDVSPTWSPTSSEMAFCSDRGGTPQIYLMTTEGLDVRRITTEGSYNTDPSFSPDGRTIAYTSRRGGTFDIALLDLAKGSVTYLTDHPSNDEQPCWSPGGEFLAFTSDRTGSYDIHVVSRHGGTPRRVGGGGTNQFPSWYR